MQYIPGRSLQDRIDRDGPLRSRGDPADRHADGRRAGRGARPGPGPPRHQAGEHPAGERRRAGQDHRLRPGPRRRRRQPDRRAASWPARRSTWRPSRPAARRSTTAPTCSAWAACSTPCAPATPRSAPRRRWPCSAASATTTPGRIREINPDIPDWLEAIVARLHAKSTRRTGSSRRPRSPSCSDAASPTSKTRAGCPCLTGPRRSTPTSGRSLGTPGSRPIVAADGRCLCSRSSPGHAGSSPGGSLSSAKTHPARGRGRRPGPARSRTSLGERPARLRSECRPSRDPGRFGRVLGTAYSPDGKTLAIACVDRTIRLWDVPSDYPPRDARRPPERGPLRRLQPRRQDPRLGRRRLERPERAGRGQTLGPPSNTETRGPEGARERGLRRRLQPRRQVGGLGQRRPDGEALGRPFRQPPFDPLGHTDVVGWVAFSPDGKNLATCSPTRPSASGTRPRARSASRIKTGQMLACIAFSPDGRTLASTAALNADLSSTGNREGGVTVWDVETGVPLHVFDEVAVEFLCVAFSPDGTPWPRRPPIYAMSGEVKLWNVAKGRLEAALPHGDVPASLAYAPDGKRLAVGLRGRLSGRLGDDLGSPHAGRPRHPQRLRPGGPGDPRRDAKPAWPSHCAGCHRGSSNSLNSKSTSSSMGSCQSSTPPIPAPTGTIEVST